MPLKVPKIDDVTFAKLLEEARNRIPQYAREWTDHNLHDPGITFIELLAWLTEMQIFYLDKITERHKLKFLKLLGTTPRPALPSKVQVTFTLSGEEPKPLDSGTKLEAQVNGKTLAFETIDSICVVPLVLNKIVAPVEEKELGTENALEPVDIAFAKVDAYGFFYPFGKRPFKDDSLYLGFDTEILEKMKKESIDISIGLNLYEKDLPQRGEHDEEPDIIPSASVKWEYSKGKEWVELDVIADSTLAFSQSGYVRFILPLDVTVSTDLELEDFEGNNHFWFRCRLEKAGFEIPPRIESIRLNTVDAVQMRKMEDDILENKTALPNILKKTTALPNQLFSLKHSPVVPRRLVLKVRERRRWREWKLVKNLASSGKEDEHYMLYPEKGCEKTKCKIKFGDDKAGRIPPKGICNIQVISYVYEQKCEEEVFSSDGTSNQIFELKKVPPIPKNLLLRIGEEGGTWSEVPDFDSSKPEDRHYILNQDEGAVQLGTGDRGRIDPENQVMASLYYYGGGEIGNVQKGTITEIVDSTIEYDKLKVENIDDAAGGRDAETLEEATTRVLKDLKKRYRAVTLEDFEYIARFTPGLRVARAKAIRRNNRIEVIVVPCMPPWEKEPVKTLSEGFRKTVCKHLDRHRLLTTQIAVTDPEYIEVSVRVTVKIKPRENPELVSERIKQKLESFLHPLDGYNGFGWPFGRAVYRSEVCAEVEEVRGVDCIHYLVLTDHEKSMDEYGNIKVPENALVFSGTHQIEIVETDEPCKERLR